MGGDVEGAPAVTDAGDRRGGTGGGADDEAAVPAVVEADGGGADEVGGDLGRLAGCVAVELRAVVGDDGAGAAGGLRAGVAAALGIDELLAHYQEVSGITLQNRPWYRAFNAFKMAVICLIGAMLYDEGHSEDEKLLLAAYGTGLLTKVGLGELGVTEELDDGPVLPRQALQN